MRKIGKAYIYRDHTICPNYGGWVVIHESKMPFQYEKKIYKTLKDAQNAYKKIHDGSHTAEPNIIGEMTDEQFIHALNI